jgi:hypothetical protein
MRSLEGAEDEVIMAKPIAMCITVSNSDVSGGRRRRRFQCQTDQRGLPIAATIKREDGVRT